MARHIVKTTFLLISGLITAGLLSFMLISDTWISINTEKLDLIEKKFENEFQIFTGQKKLEEVNPIATQPIVTNFKSNKIIKTTPTTLTSQITTSTKKSTTTTITTSTIVSTTSKASIKNFNENDQETSHDGGDLENEETDESDSNSNNNNNNNNHEDSDNLDYEQEDNSNYKRLKRADEHVTDYAYLTKLWPFVKYKSLYSECIEYRKLNLKISAAFLNQPNKEPVIGTINYGKFLNKLSNDSKNNCDSKTGMIQCLLTQDCVHGKICDGITDCDDQSDEQFCDSVNKCQTQHGGTPIQCDNRCWQFWNKCDKIPNCFDLSDELSSDCTESQRNYSFLENLRSIFNPNSTVEFKTEANSLTPFTFGKFHFDKKHGCFINYFDFKSARLIRKENLKYLTQSLADHMQDINNINYNLQLIYSMSFVSALFFTLFALMSLLCVSCFKKTCFQCPFWFYGFFAILAWLSCLFGIMTFMFQCFSTKHKTIDPLSRLPIDNELIRLNPELVGLQEFGITFWIAVAATGFSFLASFISCIVCCNLPTLRHEDKEYQIMTLPTYS